MFSPFASSFITDDFTDSTLTKYEWGFQASFILQVDQNYRYLKHNEGKELGSHKFLRIETAPSQSSSSLTDSPTSIRKPAQSAARIQQVSRAQSFEKKLSKEFGDSKFGVSVSVLSPKTRKLGQSYSDVSVLDAAIRIQANFRGYKCRKQRLFTRQGTILIQVNVLVTTEMLLFRFFINSNSNSFNS